VLEVAVFDASARVGGTDAGAGSERTVLVAHVHVEQTLTVEKLRSAMPEVLLAAAIPPAIRIHHHPLPQLASGKLDVRALREMA
jgi:acyl-coenzyme A synthetase/AMP-(fatty) acid ligase